MRVLGLQGSPRRNGNSHFLLSTFLKEAEKFGAQIHTVKADRQNIQPCREYIVCEKKGICPIEDDMKTQIYSQIRWADVIVAASPVFFFNVTAQLKALIDRCQVFWARKYKLKLRDPNAGMRRGCLLAVGASKGQKLFDGVHLTARYFFDAVDAAYDESLTYRGVEKYGDMAAHPTAAEDVRLCAARIFAPFQNRKKILFACSDNAGHSRMAAAFARIMAGDRVEVCSGGIRPADEINPMMVSAMAEHGIDMAFQTPRPIESALRETVPDIMVAIGQGENFPEPVGIRRLEWNFPNPTDGDMAAMRTIRDDIEKRVAELVGSL